MTMTIQRARGFLPGVQREPIPIPTPTPTPPPDDDITSAPSGGTGESAPSTRKDSQGRLWEYVNGEWQLAGEQFQDNSDPRAGLYPYDPSSGYVSPYPSESPIGNYAVEGGGPVNTYADPQSGILYNSKGQALPQYLQKALGGLGGSGDAVGQGNLAQRIAEFRWKQKQDEIAQENWGKQFGLNTTIADRNDLGGRANTGLGLANYARGIANDQYDRAKDPGNFPALLAAYAGLEGGAGSAPLQTLLGEGFKIQPPEGGNPLADPRLQGLIDTLYKYAGAAGTDTQAVRDAYAKYPNAEELFGNYARLDASKPKAFAYGGSFTADRPMRLEDYSTGEKLGVMGEAGKENVTVTPNHVPTAADLTPEAAQSYADYDAARGYTPSEGTNIALAKVLGPLGYPREIVDALKGGGMAGPQLFNPQVLERLQARNPSVFRLVMAAIKARVGSAGLEDYAAESERYRMGAGNATGGILR